MVLQDLWFFPGLSMPRILNNKIPGLSRILRTLFVSFTMLGNLQPLTEAQNLNVYFLHLWISTLTIGQAQTVT